MDLFRGANGGNGGGEAENDPAMEALLRERNAIGNSIQSATNVLNQASDIRGELRNQGNNLRGVGSKVLVMAGQVPGLNNLIENIKRKRGRDDQVVSVVIAVCILFTLWYILG